MTSLWNTFALFVLVTAWAGMIACSAIQIQKGSKEGNEAEPELRQMQRQIRPPFLDPLRHGELFTDPIYFPPPPEEGNKPYPVKTILITDYTDSTITVRWHDRSSVEDNTLVRRRREGGTGWEDVFTYGPVSGFQDIRDEGLMPDQKYCYQFVASNVHGQSYSPQRCAYTQGPAGNKIFRAQLTIKIANISNAETDDKVRVRLNAAPGGLTVPMGNVTVMDYGRDDFERNEVFTYDLELSGISQLTDVTMLSISKYGSNGLCMESIELLLNNHSVYVEDFSSEDDNCHWLDNDNGESSKYTVFHDSLRSSPGWQNFQSPIQTIILRDEFESRIEGLIGHLFSSIKRAKWGDKHGPRWVEAEYSTDKSVSVDLDMEAIAPVWFNPDVDIDFFVSVGFREENGEWKFEIEVSNLESSTDFDWFTETMGFLLPCGPILSLVLDEGVPDCITYLERYIDQRVESSFQSIARSFAIANPCSVDTKPSATVTSTADIVFACVEDDDNNDFDFIRIKGNTLVIESVE